MRDLMGRGGGGFEAYLEWCIGAVFAVFGWELAWVVEKNGMMYMKEYETMISKVSCGDMYNLCPYPPLQHTGITSARKAAQW